MHHSQSQRRRGGAGERSSVRTEELNRNNSKTWTDKESSSFGNCPNQFWTGCTISKKDDRLSLNMCSSHNSWVCRRLHCDVRQKSLFFVWQAALLVLRNNLHPPLPHPPRFCLQQQPCVITSNPFPSPLRLISLLTSTSTAPPLPPSLSLYWRARSQASVQSCLVFSCVCVAQRSRWRSKGRGGDRGRDERGGKEHGRQLTGELLSMKRRTEDDWYRGIFIQKTHCWLRGKWATSINLRLCSLMWQHTEFRNS